MYLKRLVIVAAVFMVTLMSLEGGGLPVEAQGVPPTIIVNAADDADDGACTDVHCNLREAIEKSNASPGIKDTILFGLPALATIQPTIALPAITDPYNRPRYH